jgi:hypothetical protein
LTNGAVTVAVSLCVWEVAARVAPAAEEAALSAALAPAGVRAFTALPVVWVPADAGLVIAGVEVDGLVAALLMVVAVLGRTCVPADAAEVGALAAGTENSLMICLEENFTGLGTG